MDIEEQPSLREIKRQMTLEAIEDNATRLILERGFDNVTIEDICAEAGISKRTFFNYVESKESVAIGHTAKLPTDEEREAFLAKRHENVIDTVFDLVINLFGNHDNSKSGVAGDIMRRRKEIRVKHPELAVQHFARFHQAREGLEHLIVEYFEKWPGSQHLDESADREAIAIVGLLISVMLQGSREWHDMPQGTQADFQACCRKAIKNTFLLRGGFSE